MEYVCEQMGYMQYVCKLFLATPWAQKPDGGVWQSSKTPSKYKVNVLGLWMSELSVQFRPEFSLNAHTQKGKCVLKNTNNHETLLYTSVLILVLTCAENYDVGGKVEV